MLVSIGFEFETASVSVVRLYTGHRVWNPKLMYRTRLNPHVSVYPDTFNENPAVQAFCKAHQKTPLRLGEEYHVPPDRLPSIFRHAEFVVTYPDPVILDDPDHLMGWCFTQMHRAIHEIQSVVSPASGWQEIERGMTIRPSFYYKGPFLVHPMHQIGLLFKNPTSTWVETILTDANFTVQCTFGIPLVRVYRVWRVLDDFYTKTCRVSRTVDPVLRAWEWVQGLYPFPEESTEGNLLCLFYYTFLTLDRRKRAVFTLRHPVSNLWDRAITKEQRERLTALVHTDQDNVFRDYFDRVTRRPHRSKLQTQKLVDVGLVPFDTRHHRIFFEYRALTRILRSIVHGRDSQNMRLSFPTLLDIRDERFPVPKQDA